VKKKILLYAVSFFLTISIFCLYSRSGILIFLFMHLIWGGYAIYRKPSRWKIMTTILIIVLAFCALFIATAPDNRFTEEAVSFESNDGRDTDPRLIIWQSAWEGAIENLPWGVGTGDGDETILHKYHENGFWMDRTHPYNAHNQFLSALLTNGIPGIILVLLYFYTPLRLAIKHRDIFLLTLFLLMFLNCLAECMFDRRAGVDFFAVMIPLLILRCKSSQCTMYNV
jgi:O-antigen ligase